MLRRLYDRVDRPLGIEAGRHGGWPRSPSPKAAFFPVPPDALLIPLVLARPDRAWRLAAICTVGQRRRRCARLLYRLCAVRAVGRAAAAAVPLRRGVRAVPGDLRAVRVVGHPDQRSDADPVQDRHHRVGRGEIRFLAVHGGQPGDARGALLPRCAAAAAVRGACSPPRRATTDTRDRSSGARESSSVSRPSNCSEHAAALSSGDWRGCRRSVMLAAKPIINDGSEETWRSCRLRPE